MPSLQFHTEQAHDRVLSRLSEFPGLAARLTSVEKIRDLYLRVQQSPDGFRLENLLDEMGINIRIDAADCARIPSLGPVVVVANHPFGVLDGAILISLLTRVRSDVKVLTNYLLGDIPELQEHCIFVDPFQTDGSIHANRRALREALSLLQAGGMLAIFPAGEVSHWQVPAGRVVDADWNDTAVRLIRRTGAAALPVFFCGQNSVKFQILGMIHPRLRSAFLLQEFLHQRGRTIEVRVGSVIPTDAVCAGTDSQAIAYLRWRTYLLARRAAPAASRPPKRRAKSGSKVQQPIALPISTETLAEEIKALPSDRLLTESGDFAVYLAKASEIPRLLPEVGRLRELTFREVGEGTGKSRDLDSFDEYYSHLLLWSRPQQELVGAYRAANTAEVIAQRGVGGLYTSTLFRYNTRLFELLGPALELGRSFVRPEYQRQYAPLFLLWKGIARLVAMHPETPVLFGAVSISNDYSDVSREMIYRFFEARMQGDDLAGLVHPRRPFRARLLRDWDCHSMTHALRNLDDLCEPITDVELDRKGLPILLRQYAKVGGKLLAFNVDRKFSDVLDGLVVVDLRRTDTAILDRYMGREAAANFRHIHGLTSPGDSAITLPVAAL